MKQLSAKKTKSGLGIGILLTGFLMAFLFMSSDRFTYNLDVELSPVGMALAKTYMDPPEDVRPNFQGYVENGEYAFYGNWPPFSFKILSYWFHLTGDNSLYSARLFSALLYAINALLFFVLLFHLNIGQGVAFFSSLIFILLPTHLEYATLVYADIWLPTFWLLALICYDKERPKRNWLCILIILLGTFFHWFVIFLLPAMLLAYFIRKYKWSLKRCIIILLVLALFIWGSEVLLVTYARDTFSIESFRKFSIFGIFSNLKQNAIRFINRSGSIGYELLFLIPLILLVKDRLSLSTLFPQKQGALNRAFILIPIALFLYIAALPRWFVGHSQGLAMFSIPIGLMAAHMLTQIEKTGSRKLITGVIGALSICLTAYLAIPQIKDHRADIERQDRTIISFITERKTTDDQKVCLFFDVPKARKQQMIIAKFGITESTNAYSFDLEAISQPEGLSRSLLFGLNKLKNTGLDDFDASTVFFISENEHDLKDLAVNDSFQINGLMVYQLKMEGF